jgi:hypothetical protein
MCFRTGGSGRAPFGSSLESPGRVSCDRFGRTRLGQTNHRSHNGAEIVQPVSQAERRRRIADEEGQSTGLGRLMLTYYRTGSASESIKYRMLRRRASISGPREDSTILIMQSPCSHRPGIFFPWLFPSEQCGSWRHSIFLQFRR